MGVHTFLKGICPKVNVIARLEYELAYYDPAVYRFKHYTSRTPHRETGVQSQVESYQSLKNGTWCRFALHSAL